MDFHAIFKAYYEMARAGPTLPAKLLMSPVCYSQFVEEMKVLGCPVEVDFTIDSFKWVYDRESCPECSGSGVTQHRPNNGYSDDVIERPCKMCVPKKAREHADDADQHA